MGLLVKFIKKCRVFCDGLKYTATGVHADMLQDSSSACCFFHYTVFVSKELGFTAVSGSAVGESANRRAHRSVQYVTRGVCLIVLYVCLLWPC